MEHIAAVFRKYAIEQGAYGAALLPSVRVEDALREAHVRDIGVGEASRRAMRGRRERVSRGRGCRRLAPPLRRGTCRGGASRARSLCSASCAGAARTLASRARTCPARARTRMRAARVCAPA